MNYGITTGWLSNTAGKGIRLIIKYQLFPRTRARVTISGSRPIITETFPEVVYQIVKSAYDNVMPKATLLVAFFVQVVFIRYLKII